MVARADWRTLPPPAPISCPTPPDPPPASSHGPTFSLRAGCRATRSTTTSTGSWTRRRAGCCPPGTPGHSNAHRSGWRPGPQAAPQPTAQDPSTGLGPASLPTAQSFPTPRSGRRFRPPACPHPYLRPRPRPRPLSCLRHCLAQSSGYNPRI